VGGGFVVVPALALALDFEMLFPRKWSGEDDLAAGRHGVELAHRDDALDLLAAGRSRPGHPVRWALVALGTPAGDVRLWPPRCPLLSVTSGGGRDVCSDMGGTDPGSTLSLGSMPEPCDIR